MYIRCCFPQKKTETIVGDEAGDICYELSGTGSICSVFERMMNKYEVNVKC